MQIHSFVNTRHYFYTYRQDTVNVKENTMKEINSKLMFFRRILVNFFPLCYFLWLLDTHYSVYTIIPLSELEICVIIISICIFYTYANVYYQITVTVDSKLSLSYTQYFKIIIKLSRTFNKRHRCFKNDIWLFSEVGHDDELKKRFVKGFS